MVSNEYFSFYSFAFSFHSKTKRKYSCYPKEKLFVTRKSNYWLSWSAMLGFSPCRISSTLIWLCQFCETNRALPAIWFCSMQKIWSKCVVGLGIGWKAVVLQLVAPVTSNSCQLLSNSCTVVFLVSCCAPATQQFSTFIAGKCCWQIIDDSNNN